MTAAGAISGWLCTRGNNAPSGSGADRPVAGVAVSKYAMKLAPAVFVLTLVIGLSALTNWLFYEAGSVFVTSKDKAWTPVDWWKHDGVLEHTPWYWVIGAGVFLFGLSWVMAHCINF